MAMSPSISVRGSSVAKNMDARKDLPSASFCWEWVRLFQAELMMVVLLAPVRSL